MKSLSISALVIILFSHAIFAKTMTQASPVAQASACISSAFSAVGDNYWKTVSLKLTNNCGVSADLQNSIITFVNKTNLNKSFWGDFSPLSYPDNALQITSQQQSANSFLSTLNLHFPNYNGTDSILPKGQSITVQFGAKTPTYVADSVKIYLASAVGNGDISLINSSAKPQNIVQAYVLVHILANGQNVRDIQLLWKGAQQITGLAAGTYSVSPESLKSSCGTTYQGSANPATVIVTSGKSVTSTITYTKSQQQGNVKIKVQALPTVLSGYTSVPTVLLTQRGTGSSVSTDANWNSTSTVSKLNNSSTYTFSTPAIHYNGYNCQPAFAPASLTGAASGLATNLTYTCSPVAQSSVNINITGAPSSWASISITLTPDNNSAVVVNQTITLNDGKGSATAVLTDGVTYTISSPAVDGYNIRYNPQPLTATANANVTINFQHK